jgi:hypothetical protein
MQYRVLSPIGGPAFSWDVGRIVTGGKDLSLDEASRLVEREILEPVAPETATTQPAETAMRRPGRRRLHG